MDFELKGKKAIVSAGGSGIGRSIVDEFINQGVSVSTCDIDARLIEEIQIKYPEIHAEVVDVGDEKTVKEFCLKSINALGGVDCLVNNAGVAGPTLPIEEIVSEDWANLSTIFLKFLLSIFIPPSCCLRILSLSSSDISFIKCFIVKYILIIIRQTTIS